MSYCLRRDAARLSWPVWAYRGLRCQRRPWAVPAQAWRCRSAGCRPRSHSQRRGWNARLRWGLVRPQSRPGRQTPVVEEGWASSSQPGPAHPAPRKSPWELGGALPAVLAGVDAPEAGIEVSAATSHGFACAKINAGRRRVLLVGGHGLELQDHLHAAT